MLNISEKLQHQRVLKDTPNIWIDVHESGLGHVSIDSCIKRITNLASAEVYSSADIKVNIYSDYPASTGISVEFVCDNLEALCLVKDVQLDFRREFGSQYVSLSLL